jgi:Spy/CpxP family protein refolding chaperone
MKLTLKSIGMAAALVAGLATLSIAGPGDGKHAMGPERVKEKVAKMKVDLALTDDQATQIEQILNDGATKAEALRKAAPAEGSTADTQQAWDQMKQNHEQTKEKVRAVLNEEQRAKFDQLEKERRSNYKHKDKPGAH